LITKLEGEYNLKVEKNGFRMYNLKVRIVLWIIQFENHTCVLDYKIRNTLF